MSTCFPSAGRASSFPPDDLRVLPALRPPESSYLPGDPGMEAELQRRAAEMMMFPMNLVTANKNQKSRIEKWIVNFSKVFSRCKPG